MKPRIPNDSSRLYRRGSHLIRASADVVGTLHQLSLRPRSSAIKDWLRRDLAEVAGRALALMTELDGGELSPGNRALVEAHTASYLTSLTP